MPAGYGTGMEGATVTITLPFPPSANRYWRHARGRTYLAKEAVEYRQAVLAACAMQGVVHRLQVDLVIIIELSAPDKRRWDLDNRIKQLLDALAYAGVYQDDGQIVRLTAIKLSPVTGGRCVVTIDENTDPLTSARKYDTLGA